MFVFLAEVNSKEVDDILSAEHFIKDSRTFRHSHSLLKAITQIVPM